MREPLAAPLAAQFLALFFPPLASLGFPFIFGLFPLVIGVLRVGGQDVPVDRPSVECGAEGSVLKFSSAEFTMPPRWAAMFL